MPKRKRPEEKPEEQFKRFVETRGVEEQRVAEAFNVIARPQKKARVKSSSG